MDGRLVVISLLAANLAVFYETQQILIENQGTKEGAWQGVKAWPAALLLTVACVSATLGIRTSLPKSCAEMGTVALLSYFYSVNWANRFAAMNATLSITVSLVAMSFWAISAGLFHKQGTPGFNVPNIWSWSCHHQNISSNPNFNQICVTQVSPPSASIQKKNLPISHIRRLTFRRDGPSFVL
jgi:hypothetical protein